MTIRRKDRPKAVKNRLPEEDSPSRSDFLKELFRECEGHIEVRGFRGKAEKKEDRKVGFFGLDKNWNITTKLIDGFCNKHKGFDLYVGIGTRDDSGKGTKKNVVNIPCVWVDVDYKDTPKEVFIEKLDSFPIKPTIVNSSGGGVHLYWLLETPAEKKSGKDVEKINKWLVTQLGGDKSAVDYSRVMRLPDTLNHKPKYELKPTCKTESINDSRYTLEDFTKYIPVEEPKKKTSTKKTDDIPEDLETIELKVKEIVRQVVKEGIILGDDSYQSSFDIGASLADGLGEKGREYYHSICRQFSVYDEGRSEKRYTEHLNYTPVEGEKKKTIATLYYLAKKAGIGFGSLYFTNKKDGCLYRKKITTKNGSQTSENIKLANFDAKILKDITRDDGVEQIKVYKIAGKIKGKNLPDIEVPVKTFESMSWVNMWGAKAIISPGQSLKDYIRHYIQINSDADESTQYSHTGWIQTKKGWSYLTKKGSIGEENLSVNLSTGNRRYNLPLKVKEKFEDRSIKTSLGFLNVADPEIAYPLFALTYLAPLTTLLDQQPNFSMFLYGKTGHYKSSISTLALSHYGKFNISELPNFSDTANSIERRMSDLKDSLMILDDYHPSANRFESQGKESILQRILRAIGNRASRGRLKSDTSERKSYTPRACVLITGESLVQVESSLSRAMVIEIKNKDQVDIEKLSKLQEGKMMRRLPRAMTSYIEWLRPRIEDIQERFEDTFPQLRMEYQQKGCHSRVPEQPAFLMFALQLVMEWMIEKEVITPKKSVKVLETAKTVFKKYVSDQSKRLEEETPTRKYIEIFRTLLNQQKIHLLSKDKEYYEGVGFDSSIGGQKDKYDNYKSTHVGYYDYDYLYVLPQGLYKEVVEFANRSNSFFSATERQMRKHLKEEGVLIQRAGHNSYSMSGMRYGNATVMRLLREKVLPEGKKAKAEEKEQKKTWKRMMSEE